MTWTYDPGTSLFADTAAGRRDQIRLLLGDTDTNDQLLTDEEIAYFLAQNNDEVKQSAIAAIDAILGKMARQVDRAVGDLEIQGARQIQHYLALKKNLREELARQGGAGIFSGNDPEQRLFEVGMHDYPVSTEHRAWDEVT